MQKNHISIRSIVHERAELRAPVNIVEGVEIYPGSIIGAYTYINKNSVVYGSVEIGKFCSIGRCCHIGLHRHPISFLSTHPFTFSSAQFGDDPLYRSLKSEKWSFSRPTQIGSDVWIGTGALILGGISIGSGAIVSAGAVVTNDVPPYSIVGGNPAKLIRLRFTEAQISRLIKISWWNMELALLKGLPFSDVDKCIEILEQKTLDNIK